MRQQIAKRDRSFRFVGSVQRSLRIAEHAQVRELRAQIAIGSSSANRPSSSSINAATVVTGLVIDAMRKMVSRSTDAHSRGRGADGGQSATSPFRHTSAAAPASCPASTTA
jgi:hypothetical protein